MLSNFVLKTNAEYFHVIQLTPYWHNVESGINVENCNSMVWSAAIQLSYTDTALPYQHLGMYGNWQSEVLGRLYFVGKCMSGSVKIGHGAYTGRVLFKKNIMHMQTVKLEYFCLKFI